MRAVRCRRQPRRQRAAHAGPPRLDERVDQDRDARERRHACAPGDVYVLNDPYNGGTHLPDVTVVTPVFDERGRARSCSSSRSRGHHADIGGITPGSMPPDRRARSTRKACCSTTSSWSRPGGMRESRDARAARRGAVPGAQPDQNVADLRAQIAANEKGVRGAAAGWSTHFGLDIVQAYMRHVQDNAEESVRRVIDGAHDGAFALRDGQRRDDPRRDRGRPRGAQRDDRLHRHQPAAANNFNAPSAVVHAAVLYVFRTLVDDDIPLNAGCLRPLTIDRSRRARCCTRLSGGGGRRQRRDVAVRHRRALRRAGRDGRVAGHDEQLHLRQRALPVLRDDRRRLGRGRRLRRHGGGADAHDQLAPDRPGGARVALPGACSRATRSARGIGGAGRWRGGDGARCAACASSSR